MPLNHKSEKSDSVKQNDLFLVNDKPLPQSLGVPHKEFRNAQWDAIKKAKGVLDNPSKDFIFAEAPTGVGKTAIATAMGSYRPVTVYVGTLNLLDQYVREYGFVGVKGKGNYPCAHTEKIAKWAQAGMTPTAGDCHFSKMWDCPHAHNCEYLIKKKLASEARRTIVTYAYGSLSRSIQDRTGILVLDEGHGSADHILQFASFEISDFTRRRYNLPEFPSKILGYGEGGRGAIASPMAIGVVKDYLNDCCNAIDRQMVFMQKLSDDYAKLQKVYDRYRKASENLDSGVWFLECSKYSSTEKIKESYVKAPGIKLKAMDASTVASRFWGNKDMTLIMSATIGDPEPLAKKLGINMKLAEHHVYEHPVPAEARPIEDLKMQKMTYSNLRKNPRLLQIQGVTIGAWINKLDPEWRGIVLTSSYRKIKALDEALADTLQGNRRRMTQRPGMRIDELTQAFLTDQRPGDVLVASIQGFGEGLDLQGELARFAVIAGVPFDNPTDAYIQAMRSTPGGHKYLLAKTYATIPQACGRVSRATKTEDGEWRLNIASIADRSATTPIAKRYYPKFFRDAMEAGE